MPEGAIYVGRPSLWGNPFRADDPLIGAICHAYGYPDRPQFRDAMAFDLYRAWMTGEPVPVNPHARFDWKTEMQFTEGTVGGTAWIVGVGTIALPQRPDVSPLRGHDLACWCDPDDLLRPCHADVLLELANR